MVVDATNSTEEVVLEEETTEEEGVTLSKEEHEELLKKAEQFPNVVARAKKAEEEAKKLRSKTVTEESSTINKTALSEENVDVKILQSQGMDEEAIEYLKKLAKVNETSLLAAQHDELFVSYKSQKEAKEKAEKATLGASRGSGQMKKGKNFSTPGLSDADHKEMWRKAEGK